MSIRDRVGSKAARDVASYVKAPFVRMLIPNSEEGGYLAEVLELPGCISEGETPEEAYENLEDAMSGWIAASLEHNRPIPEPVGDREYSGHFPLRISTELHRAAALRAIQEGISLNQWIAKAIAAHVAGDNLVEALVDRIAAKVAERVPFGIGATAQIQIMGSGAPSPSDFLQTLVSHHIFGGATSEAEERIKALWENPLSDTPIGILVGRKEVTESA